jgi:hypothetical protein
MCEDTKEMDIVERPQQEKQPQQHPLSNTICEADNYTDVQSRMESMCKGSQLSRAFTFAYGDEDAVFESIAQRKNQPVTHISSALHLKRPTSPFTALLPGRKDGASEAALNLRAFTSSSRPLKTMGVRQLHSKDQKDSSTNVLSFEDCEMIEWTRTLSSEWQESL